MNKRKLIFRVDGNKKIGLGHLYRCLGLAEVISKDFNCSFAISNPDQNIVKLIQDANFNLWKLDEIIYSLPDEMEQ